MIASIVFLTPYGALLALTVVVPLLALVVASRRERQARVILGLAAPGRARRARGPLALVAVVGLLGLAASQPVIRSTTTQSVRTDAEAFYVIDISRSMLASHSAGAATRIARARAAAVELRDRLPGIPSGVATITDHVLPDLMPVPSRAVFDQTVRQAVQVDNPPPATDSVTATNLGALGALGTQSFYSPAAKHRVAIVLTDGESRPFDVRQTARALGQSPGVTPIFVHISSPGEAVYDSTGRIESAYHSDPSSGQTLSSLAQATGGSRFSESSLGAAARAVGAAVGSGPTSPQGLTVSTQALGPYAALAALVPLLIFVLPSMFGLRSRRRSRRPATKPQGVVEPQAS